MVEEDTGGIKMMDGITGMDTGITTVSTLVDTTGIRLKEDCYYEVLLSNASVAYLDNISSLSNRALTSGLLSMLREEV